MTARPATIAMTLLATTLLVAPTQAGAQDVQADSDGITIGSEDGESEFRIGGRLHYDAVRFDDDITPLDDRSGFRRARIALSGRFARDWRFRVEHDFGGTSKGWKSLWLAYGGFDHWDLRAGHLVAPVGIEAAMGSNDMPLMERSMSSTLSPGFLLGAQATYARHGWTGTLGYYGDPIDTEQDSSGQDGRGAIGRVTFAPLRGKGKILHLGASIEDRRVAAVSSPDGYRISARPGAGLAERNLISTGVIPGVARTRTLGAELGAVAGPAMLLADSLRTRVERDAGQDLDFGGWQVIASWMLTGETRRYNDDTGAIGRIKPDRRWGALELAARYDRLDLDDGDVAGGRERNLSYGLNWYWRENFRLMLNHVEAEADPNRNGQRESVGIDQMRVQVDF